jgi:hypothetical protein
MRSNFNLTDNRMLEIIWCMYVCIYVCIYIYTYIYIGYHLRIPYLEIPRHFSVYSSLTKALFIGDVNGLKLAENARC